MSIIKLTQDLENFKWTDYSKVGTPQSFYDGHSSIVTGQKTFERPNPKSLDQMVSKFGPLNTQPNNRGPYGVTDYMDGTKQGQGFTPPGGPPLGFTVDMGPSLYAIGDPLTLTLTPLSYTIAGINSALSYGVVPEQTININPSAEGAWGNFNLPIETYSSRIISKNIEDILSYSLPYRSYGSEHPFIIRDIGEKWGPSGFGSGIVTAINRTDADIRRINKFLGTSQGVMWSFMQYGLQLLNPRKETRGWDPTSITLSLIPMFHAQRHLTFSPGTYEDAIGKNKGEKSILSGYGRALVGTAPKLELPLVTSSKRFTIAHLLGQVPSAGGKMSIPAIPEIKFNLLGGNIDSLSSNTFPSEVGIGISIPDSNKYSGKVKIEPITSNQNKEYAVSHGTPIIPQTVPEAGSWIIKDIIDATSEMGGSISKTLTDAVIGNKFKGDHWGPDRPGRKYEQSAFTNIDGRKYVQIGHPAESPFTGWTALTVKTHADDKHDVFTTEPIQGTITIPQGSLIKDMARPFQTPIFKTNVFLGDLYNKDSRYGEGYQYTVEQSPLYIIGGTDSDNGLAQAKVKQVYKVTSDTVTPGTDKIYKLQPSIPEEGISFGGLSRGNRIFITGVFQGDRYGDTDTTDANWKNLGTQYWSDHGTPTVPLHPVEGKERALGHTSIPKAKQKIIFNNVKSPITNLYTTKLGDIGEVQVTFPNSSNVLDRSQDGDDITTLAQYYGSNESDPKPSWSLLQHNPKDFISTPYERLNSDNSYDATDWSMAGEHLDWKYILDGIFSPLIEYSWRFFNDTSELKDEELHKSSIVDKLIHSSKADDGTDSMLIKRYSTLAYGSIPGSIMSRPGDAEKDEPFPKDDAKHGRYDYETTLRSASELNLNKDGNERPDWLKRLSEKDAKGDRDKKKKINQGIGTPGKPGHEPTVDPHDDNSFGVLKLTDGDKYKTDQADKINLIPYGRDYKDGEEDFIKFKFKDIINNKFIIFRAILSGISDSISPEWASEKYIGRPDKVHVYQGTERAISFTFNVYPKTKQEFPVLMEKLNYLIGLCYPTYTSENRMISPFIELTLGDMFNKTPGFLSSLTIEVDDNSTWEIDEGLQFPKYITCGCEFTYIGKYLPSSLGKHYELNWLNDRGWSGGSDTGEGATYGTFNASKNTDTKGNFPIESNPTRTEYKNLFSQLKGENR